MRKLTLGVILSLFGTMAFGARVISPFELPQMNGAKSTYRSLDHKETVFVVEAYFLGCPYCNENAPQVNDLADKFANDPQVQVLDVGIDRRDDQYATWIRRHNPNHPVLKDANRKLIGQLGTSGYPSTYVIDCNGRVVYKTSGEWEGSTAQEIANAVTDTRKSQVCAVK